MTAPGGCGALQDMHSVWSPLRT